MSHSKCLKTCLTLNVPNKSLTQTVPKNVSNKCPAQNVSKQRVKVFSRFARVLAQCVMVFKDGKKKRDVWQKCFLSGIVWRDGRFWKEMWRGVTTLVELNLPSKAAFNGISYLKGKNRQCHHHYIKWLETFVATQNGSHFTLRRTITHRLLALFLGLKTKQ